MKKIVLPIFLLLVFLNFQFGKMANYIHCKWQTAWIQPDCGCDEILIDHFGDDGSPGTLDKEGLKQIASEYHPGFNSFEKCLFFFPDKMNFRIYKATILKGTDLPAFHPPSA